ncbi:MAG: acylphosphatase [Deltaproteobacteria bacterium]|nr:acylphosphatase [Deltaproteobacteria bacterium]
MNPPAFKGEAIWRRLGPIVEGWVRNLPDGRVEAVLEGDEADVKSMVKWCKAGPPLSRVTDVSLNWEPYTGEFGDFEVTFVR